MTGSRLRLLTRKGCHLCEYLAEALKRHEVVFEALDVDSDSTLKQSYGNAVPVLLLGEQELARAPISLEDVLRQLKAR